MNDLYNKGMTSRLADSISEKSKKKKKKEKKKKKKERNKKNKKQIHDANLNTFRSVVLSVTGLCR